MKIKLINMEDLNVEQEMEIACNRSYIVRDLLIFIDQSFKNNIYKLFNEYYIILENEAYIIGINFETLFRVKKKDSIIDEDMDIIEFFNINNIEHAEIYKNNPHVKYVYMKDIKPEIKNAPAESAKECVIKFIGIGAATNPEIEKYADKLLDDLDNLFKGEK